MTLILTMIGPPGFVHVSDSNLSYGDGRRAGVSKKLFKAARLRVGIACAGAFSVNGIGMDEWLPARIREYEMNGGTTVRSLADWLSRSLKAAMTPDEKRDGSWLHVAGYTPEAGGWHPEMYVVGNVPGFDAHGNYLAGQPTFHTLVEEYWTPRSPTPDGQPVTTVDSFGLWFNGFPPGRIAWEGVRQELRGFLAAVWDHPEWRFRPPSTLRELATYLSLHLSVIAHPFSDQRLPWSAHRWPNPTIVDPPTTRRRVINAQAPPVRSRPPGAPPAVRRQPRRVRVTRRRQLADDALEVISARP